VTASLVVVLVLAVVFDYINGFHDTANAIATSVATRALRPQHAILMAAAFNFIGAFAGTAVAKTIGAGLVDEATTSQAIVMAALLGAIAWNLLTWRLGIPSSSSHALIGGLLGATVLAAGTGAVKWASLVDKVLVPLVSSPVLGFIIAFSLMVALYWIFRRARRRPMTRGFRRLQVLSAGYMAFSHGSNDAQKTMGIVTLALFSAGVIPTVDVPVWVIIGAASAISLGTAVGGWRIMRTMGHRVVELEPIHGFAAETTALVRTSDGQACKSEDRHFIATKFSGQHAGNTRKFNGARAYRVVAQNSRGFSRQHRDKRLGAAGLVILVGVALKVHVELL